MNEILLRIVDINLDNGVVTIENIDRKTTFEVKEGEVFGLKWTVIYDKKDPPLPTTTGIIREVAKEYRKCSTHQ